MLNLLRDLCMLNGPSGCEDAVADYVKNFCMEYTDEIKTDSIGNVLVFKKGKKTRAQKLMVCAHMDEVGFIIKRFTDDGMIKFGFVGGIDSRVVIGRRVLLGDKKVNGVIGIKAVHLTSASERQTMPKSDDLYIDIGATSKSEAMAKLSLGDFGVFDSEYTEFGDGFIKARAIDDRVGVAVMLKLIQSELEYDTWFAFTCQEEVGLRGATVAAYSINPDTCLVIEGTTAADLPKIRDADKVCSLRNGVVIPFMDRATIYDKDLFTEITALANKHNIKWQTKQMVSGGTDAGKIHLSRDGVRTIAVAVPTRYIHSPSCVCALEDVEAMLKLATLYIGQ